MLSTVFLIVNTLSSFILRQDHSLCIHGYRISSKCSIFCCRTFFVLSFCSAFKSNIIDTFQKEFLNYVEHERGWNSIHKYTGSCSIKFWWVVSLLEPYSSAGPNNRKFHVFNITESLQKFAQVTHIFRFFRSQLCCTF